jgi:hypothetical protein
MKQTALAIIEDARTRGALMYVPQNIETPPLYKLEASVIEVEPKDFHEIEGKLVPRKEICDRIGDAAGVDFIAAQCGVRTETHDDEFGKRTVYIGFAQGRIRLSDGSWRASSVEEYEFDPTLRAKAEGGGERKVLAYVKVARQRASTGARMRVIRQLVGMPTAFEKTAIGNGAGLTFSRIVQNTDYILQTPEGKMMAIAMATGAASSLYGPRQSAPARAEETATDPEPRNVTPTAAEEPAGDPFSPAGLERGVSSEALEAAMQTIAEWAAADTIPEAAGKAAQAIIDRGETNVEILKAAAKLLRLQSKKLTPGARDLAVALLRNQAATLSAYEDLISRTEDLLKKTGQAVA